MNASKRGLRALVCLTLLAALLPGAVAAAVEAPSRDEYVERLETVCKPEAEATRRAMKGARADIEAERLAVAESVPRDSVPRDRAPATTPRGTL